MVLVVEAGDMRIVDAPGDILVTPPLGAAVALALTDRVAGVAGILHFLLPASEVDQSLAIDAPALFADTGIAAFLRAAAAMGASRSRIRIAMAGGAQPVDTTDFYSIGARNQAMARKLLWKNGLSIAREHVGGTRARTLKLETDTGRAWLVTHNGEQEL